MKITQILSSIIVLAVILTISSCGPDPAPQASIEEQQLQKLIATWKITTDTQSDVLFGTTTANVSKKTEYANFQLTISGTPGSSSFGYTTTGKPSGSGNTSPWPSSGTWSFGANPETQVVRDPDKAADKLDMTYAISSDGSTLELSFNFTGTGYPARVASIAGQWKFTFKK
jgi:hypothetical protein